MDVQRKNLALKKCTDISVPARRDRCCAVCIYNLKCLKFSQLTTYGKIKYFKINKISITIKSKSLPASPSLSLLGRESSWEYSLIFSLFVSGNIKSTRWNKNFGGSIGLAISECVCLLTRMRKLFCLKYSFCLPAFLFEKYKFMDPNGVHGPSPERVGRHIQIYTFYSYNRSKVMTCARRRGGLQKLAR